MTTPTLNWQDFYPLPDMRLEGVPRCPFCGQSMKDTEPCIIGHAWGLRVMAHDACVDEQKIKLAQDDGEPNWHR